MPDRRHLMDFRPRDGQRLSSGLAAGLGARPRIGHLRHRVLRGDDRRQRTLGAACLKTRLAGGTLPRRRGRRRGDRADLALEASNRCGNRPCALDALAGTCLGDRPRR